MADEKQVGQVMKGRKSGKLTKKNARSALAMPQTTRGVIFCRAGKMVVVVKEKRVVAKRG